MQLIFIRLLDMYFLMNLKSLDWSFNQNMSLDKKALKITLWSLFMDRVPCLKVIETRNTWKMSLSNKFLLTYAIFLAKISLCKFQKP